jgi:PAS domain-containing protein
MLLKSYEELKCDRCGKIVRFNGIADGDESNRYLLLTSYDGKIVNASPSIERNIGFSLNEIVGKNVNELYFSEQQRSVDKIFISKITKFKYFRWDTSHKAKDGSEVPIVICMRSFQENGRDYILRIVDKVIFPDEAFESRNKFDSQNHCDFVTEMDSSGNFLYVDKQVRNFYGYEQEELLGRNVRELYAPDEAEWRDNNQKALFHKRQSFRIPCFRAKHKDGHFVDCESIASPFYDDLGDFVGYRHLNWMKK